MAHQRVVEAVMENGTVLPLRFGTRLGSEPELVAVLAARHDELVRAIERVRGHVEIGLRVIPRSSAERQPKSLGAQPVDAGGNRVAGRKRPTGRAYLLERVTEHHLAER